MDHSTVEYAADNNRTEMLWVSINGYLFYLNDMK